jgi:acetyl-CoA carboxylase biotin carboxyl carrier protein
MSQILALMAGNVYKVLVKPGDRIEAGTEVVILESMKMEIPIEADSEGRIKEVHATEGLFVNEGDILIDLE